MFKKIMGNVQIDSWNIEEDSGECWFRFWTVLVKVSGNLNVDSLCEIVLIFLSNSAVRLRQNKVIKQLLINSSENIFSRLLVN